MRKPADGATVRFVSENFHQALRKNFGIVILNLGYVVAWRHALLLSLQRSICLEIKRGVVVCPLGYANE